MDGLLAHLNVDLPLPTIFELVFQQKLNPSQAFLQWQLGFVFWCLFFKDSPRGSSPPLWGSGSRASLNILTCLSLKPGFLRRYRRWMIGLFFFWLRCDAWDRSHTDQQIQKSPNNINLSLVHHNLRPLSAQAFRSAFEWRNTLVFVLLEMGSKFMKHSFTKNGIWERFKKNPKTFL